MVALYCYVMAGFQVANRKFQDKMKGATAVEYGIMVALIAVVIITAVAAIGLALNGKFEFVQAELEK